MFAPRHAQKLRFADDVLAAAWEIGCVFWMLLEEGGPWNLRLVGADKSPLFRRQIIRLVYVWKGFPKGGREERPDFLRAGGQVVWIVPKYFRPILCGKFGLVGDFVKILQRDGAAGEQFDKLFIGENLEIFAEFGDETDGPVEGVDVMDGLQPVGGIHFFRFQLCELFCHDELLGSDKRQNQ